MEKRVLGRTGLWVSKLGLGTGQFGTFGQTTKSECVRVAHVAFDGGITLADTADFYSLGQAETITGKAVAGRRQELVIATKCGMPMSDNPNYAGASRHWITASVEASLKRLQTDYIDLYQIHRFDPATGVEETLHALNDLVRAGKIRYYGFSNSPVEHLIEARLRADMRNLLPPHSEQAKYSLFNRTAVLPVCHRHDIGFLAYSPLDGGWLSGKYRRGHDAEPSARQRLQPGRYNVTSAANARRLELVEKLTEIADGIGIQLSHLGVAAVLAHRAVTAALIGGSTTHRPIRRLAWTSSAVS